MTGMQLSKSKGHPGVLNQTKFEHYESGLPNFKLIEKTEMITPFGNKTSTNPYHRDCYFSFWKRNKIKKIVQKLIASFISTSFKRAVINLTLICN